MADDHSGRYREPQAGARKIFDLSTQDDYADPGSVVMTTTPSGETVALQDKDWVYLRGAGASPRGTGRSWTR